MHDPKEPSFPLEGLLAAARRGEMELWEDAAWNGLPTTGMTKEEVMECFSCLTEACFVKSEISEREEFKGEPYDVYFYHTSRTKGIWFKVALHEDGSGRIFSLHKSKTPKELRRR